MDRIHNRPASPNEIPLRRSSIGALAPSRTSRPARAPREDNGPGPSMTKSNFHAKMNRSRSGTLEETHAENGLRSHKGKETKAGIGSDLIFHTPPRTWSPAKENILLGPYEYLYGTPGKDIRSQLISAFNAWLKVPTASLSVITKVVGMLHTASLLVDDVEDSSLLRRGQPVAHSIFGTAQTINSANYVYFCALQELQKLNNPKAIQIYTDELLNLHRGQGMDLYWRDTLTCPSEEDYLEMVNNKTGGLFRLAVKLMQAESSCSLDCVPLVNTIGLLFQILDDYKNLSSTTYTINKGLAEDLTEGKFSFPIIHAIRASPSQALVLINILKQRTSDLEVKKYTINYLEQAGSFEYTRKVLRELTERALDLIDSMDRTDDDTTTPSAGLGTGVRLIIEKLKTDEERTLHSP